MFHKNDYKYFQKAKNIASMSDCNKVHIGCVSVYQKRVIGAGFNCSKTHPIQKYYNQFRNPEGDDISMTYLPKLHAEISCINQIKHLNINFSKVKLYIFRIRNDQPFGMARPCPSCMAAIKDLGIRDIYYTTNDGFVHERLEKYKEGSVA